VHYADDTDAKLQMMMAAIVSEQTGGVLTSSRNPLKQRLYRGPASGDARRVGPSARLSSPQAPAPASPSEEMPLFGD
jgi:hypothetical protein